MKPPKESGGFFFNAPPQTTPSLGIKSLQTTPSLGTIYNMFKRAIEEHLKDWKKSENRKPLVLRGARQTGKTTAIKQFAKGFKNLVEINLEIDAMQRIFSEMRGIEEIIQSLESAANQRIIPGETLLFLDEIQNSMQAIKALRYFYEKAPSLHVIAAGSLLEVRMKREGWSFPVGRVDFLYLYPVSFVEFLHALKEEIILENMYKCGTNNPIPGPVHEKALSLLADYMVIGGMPEAVNLFLTAKSAAPVRNFQEALLLSFKEDFAKYSNSSDVKYLKLVWDMVPFEIGNRIKYSKISGPAAVSKKISEAFDVLHEAMLVERIFPATSTSLPLARKMKSAPKALFLDIGLCAYALNLNKDQVYKKLINPVFEGALFEEFVGQELLALDSRNRRPLFFWIREEKGASSELDYIFQIKNNLLPVEVKSGSHGSLKSLHQFLLKSGQKLGVRIYGGPLKLEDHEVTIPGQGVIRYKLLSIPFYLVFRIEDLFEKISNSIGR